MSAERARNLRHLVTLVVMVAVGWAAAIWFMFAYMMNGADCGRFTPC